MTYFSTLPWLAVGPLQVGAREADGVGRCDSPGVALVDGECTMSRAAACAVSGKALHTDGERCAITAEQLCALIPGTTFADGQCDHESVVTCAATQAQLDALGHGSTFAKLPGGGCRVDGVPDDACAALGFAMVDGVCSLLPSFSSPLEALCDGGVVEGDRCLTQPCPPGTKLEEGGVCRLDFAALITPPPDA